jgi:hypothetical protein
MQASDRRRRAFFIAAFAALVALGGAVAALGNGGQGAVPAAGPDAGARPAVRAPAARRIAEGARTAAARRALDFLAAYLRYERGGAAGRAAESALERLATPGLAAQLRQAPVRAPAGAVPPAEWVSRATGIRVGIFDGREALLVSVLVVGTGGSHVLTPTLVRGGGSWIVAGIGE